MLKESNIYLAIAKYMAISYPSVVWRFDFSAGTKMTLGQARKHKAMNPHRGYPDLFICQCRNGYGGLYLEIKNAKIYKKDGQLLNDRHIQEQADMISHLRNAGYKADFSIGIDDCIKKIDAYLKM